MMAFTGQGERIDGEMRRESHHMSGWMDGMDKYRDRAMTSEGWWRYEELAVDWLYGRLGRGEDEEEEGRSQANVDRLVWKKMPRMECLVEIIGRVGVWMGRVGEAESGRV